MEKCNLPKKTLLLWQIRIGMLAVMITAGSAFLMYASPWFLILVGGLAVFFGLTLFWYLPRYFNSYEISLSDGAIIIKKGFFVHIVHIMPYSRLVYTESFTTPVAKYLKLSAMTLKAARSTVVIPEMLEEDVKRLVTALTGEVD